MKITIVHGQSHRGSTCAMARLLAQKLGGEVTEFFLPRDFDKFCAGCSQCFEKSEKACPHFAKLEPITAALDAADVILLASPVYVFHATGAMKSLLDHYAYRWMVHRPAETMFSKQGVAISTAAGAGMKSTNKDLADSLFFWGCAKVYRCGVAVREISWERVSTDIKRKIERKTSILARKIRRNYPNIRPSVKTKSFFALMRRLQKRGWNEADVAYWREKGWDKKTRPWRGAAGRG